jgi:hypothetical protein
MKALSLTIQKIRQMLKFLKSGSNVKVTRSTIMISMEMSCHKEHTYESTITYMYHSKDMTNVKLFEKLVKRQGQVHKVKNYGTNRKVLS